MDVGAVPRAVKYPKQTTQCTSPNGPAHECSERAQAQAHMQPRRRSSSPRHSRTPPDGGALGARPEALDARRAARPLGAAEPALRAAAAGAPAAARAVRQHRRHRASSDARPVARVGADGQGDARRRQGHRAPEELLRRRGVDAQVVAMREELRELRALVVGPAAAAAAAAAALTATTTSKTTAPPRRPPPPLEGHRPPSRRPSRRPSRSKPSRARSRRTSSRWPSRSYCCARPRGGRGGRSCALFACSCWRHSA